MASEKQRFLPYGRQTVDEEDIAQVAAVLRGDWLTTGPAVEEFEQTLAETVGANHAVVCNSGTAALHLAMLALEIGADQAVIVPSLTFLASANAARFVGAEVVFADVDRESGLMNADDFERAISQNSERNLAAVIPVHYAGQCADLADISAVADRHGLAVVEDAAHAIGTQYDIEGELGAIGDCRYSRMTMFSFHPVKTVTMAEGGAVTTNKTTDAERLRYFRSHGMTHRPQDFENKELAFSADGEPNPWYYEMRDVGLNYRATDVQCALGLSQLGKLKEFVSKRTMLVDAYDSQLRQLANILKPLKRRAHCSPAWHLYPIRINFAALGIDRAKLMGKLRDKGIGSQVHYIPVHLQPYYLNRYGKISLPGAEAIYEELLSLPLFPGMKLADVDRVVDALSEIIQENKSAAI